MHADDALDEYSGSTNRNVNRRYSSAIDRFRNSLPQSGHVPGTDSLVTRVPHSKHSYVDADLGSSNINSPSILRINNIDDLMLY